MDKLCDCCGTTAEDTAQCDCMDVLCVYCAVGHVCTDPVPEDEGDPNA